MRPQATRTPRDGHAPIRLGKARLMAMIEEATVDAYGESEQATGLAPKQGMIIP